jgi:hypothetical protein
MLSESQLFFMLVVVLGALVIIGVVSCALRARHEERQHQRSRSNEVWRRRQPGPPARH